MIRTALDWFVRSQVFPDKPRDGFRRPVRRGFQPRQHVGRKRDFKPLGLVLSGHRRATSRAFGGGRAHKNVLSANLQRRSRRTAISDGAGMFAHTGLCRSSGIPALLYEVNADRFRCMGWHVDTVEAFTNITSLSVRADVIQESLVVRRAKANERSIFAVSEGCKSLFHVLAFLTGRDALLPPDGLFIRAVNQDCKMFFTRMKNNFCVWFVRSLGWHTGKAIVQAVVGVFK